MGSLVNAFGHVQLNVIDVDAMVECAGGMAFIHDDERYGPNVITALKRPGNVRVMNVWGEPAPQPWLQHRFPWAAPRG